MQLCLGTVQFGMNYGICGQKQPSVEAACEMLDYAVHNGISHIDTAKQYGTAEDVVGIFLRKKQLIVMMCLLAQNFNPTGSIMWLRKIIMMYLKQRCWDN